jgi:hypothetical protein
VTIPIGQPPDPQNNERPPSGTHLFPVIEEMPTSGLGISTKPTECGGGGNVEARIRSIEIRFLLTGVPRDPFDRADIIDNGDIDEPGDPLSGWTPSSPGTIAVVPTDTGENAADIATDGGQPRK